MIGLFSRSRNYARHPPPPSSIVPEKFTLDNVATSFVYLGVEAREVPRFLVEAFTRFRELKGNNVEWIFRKEGNTARMKGYLPIFFGCDKIPSTLQVHDLCSWIKKFFRELKTPLFDKFEDKIIEIVGNLGEDSVLVAPLISTLDKLPPLHLGTLGYLVRCLQEIAKHAERHQMTVDNLATVFAPSLFRGETKSSKSSKAKRGSQEDLLAAMLKTNDLQVLAVKLLIENAQLIGFVKEFPKNVVEPKRRSNSLARAFGALKHPFRRSKSNSLEHSNLSPSSNTRLPSRSNPQQIIDSLTKENIDPVKHNVSPCQTTKAVSKNTPRHLSLLSKEASTGSPHSPSSSKRNETGITTPTRSQLCTEIPRTPLRNEKQLASYNSPSRLRGTGIVGDYVKLFSEQQNM